VAEGTQSPLVVALLANFAGQWFTIAEIAAQAGVSVSTARKHAVALVRRGLVEVDEGTPRFYRWSPTDDADYEMTEDVTSPDHVVGLTL
jgi:predicted ArsR family transcriptional regulator